MSVQTLTTVGFGDVYPATQGGRAFARPGEEFAAKKRFPPDSWGHVASIRWVKDPVLPSKNMMIPLVNYG